MMRLTGVLVMAFAASILLSGCVPVTYTKSITVHKDGAGKITGTDEYESITEPHSEGTRIKSASPDIPFQYLK